MNDLFRMSSFSPFVLLKGKKSKTVAKSSNMEIAPIRVLKIFPKNDILKYFFPLIQKYYMCIKENAGNFMKANGVNMLNSLQLPHPEINILVHCSVISLSLALSLSQINNKKI